MIISTQILTAIQTRLTGDAGITALVNSANIGNHLSQDSGFPNIFYQVDWEELGVKGESGINATLQIDINTDYRGDKSAFDIADAVKAALQDTPLTIASGDCFGTTFTAQDIQQDPDGIKHVAIMLFNLMYGE